jgi:type I restriction enzyme S subunit
MSAVMEAHEPSAKYLSALQPRLVQHFELLGTAPGGVARLRELILTLAVQGKLVPQDPSDEPASELLQKIRVEKDRLISAGKLKRDKPLASLGDEECPFDLPSAWTWARLGQVAKKITDGTHHSPANFPTGDFKYLSAKNIKSWGIDLSDVTYVPAAIHDEIYARCDPELGDILFIKDGATTGVLTINTLDEPFSLLSSVGVIKPSCGISSEWLALLMKSPFFYRGMRAGMTGVAITRVTLSKLGAAITPLPPLAEQARIVTRVEELMRLCDALEAKGQLEAAQHAQLVQTLLGALTASATPDDLADNWQRVATHFDLLLDRPEAIDALEQTILQLAVRGLLVPQDPKAEPASVLLQKIRVEKDRLIAEGKIKRDKLLSPVDDAEVPFNLPSGWTWARFPELGEFGRGKSKHRPRNDPALFEPPIYPVVQTGEVARAKGVIQEFHSKYSEVGLAQSKLWPTGTLCITIAANIADAAVLGFDACFPDSVVGFVPAQSIGRADYFLAFMETAKAHLTEFAPATAQKNINLEILEALLVPLPPLEEISRIVDQVTSLRRLCADLRQRLAARQTTQKHLAEALIDEVA